MDRPWIHPSELGRSAGRPPAGPTGARPPRTWRRDLLLTVSAGAIGAIATVSILGLAGALGRDDTAAPPTPRASRTDAATVAARVGPSIAAVAASVGGAVSRGSGVAVGNHDVLTTADVVPPDADDRDVWIATPAGERHAASVAGRDPMTGLVLLHVPTWRATAARWESSGVRAGDWVAAIGRLPAGEPWIANGVVSGVGTWITDTEGRNHAGLITADATMTDDVRGGALVDRDGHVVGVLTRTTDARDQVAVTPGPVADDIARQLAERGWASHGALGIRVGETPRGATVVEVLADGCAERAGVRPGDRITAIDGVQVKDTAGLVAEVQRREAGTRVVMTVRRAGATHRLDGTLGEAADAVTDGTEPVALSAGG
jgi:S1-C subfamily serine protease